MIEKQVKIRENQVEINYLQEGHGKNTLLFLHGWCINSAYWKDQIAQFSMNHQVYALDLPGFGKSTAKRENWTIEEYAKDVSAFIEQLDLENVVLIAHSMSGDIMLETALADNPQIKGIIGIDNFKFIDVEFTPEQREQMSAFFSLLQNDFKTNAPIYAENMLFHPSTKEEIKERVKSDFANANPKTGFDSFIHMMQFFQNVPFKLENLPLKLYLINSNVMPTNETGLENRCKNGFHVETIDSTGHYPMIEKSGEFNRKLENVLDLII
ncbi:alpha/beta hydrolase [Xanthovirga aplysinae]|uniref:alpha/beta hydrolase n=1 Tax=Xanthovirga aplysinae TaxID=2529853 RepID=UPI0012BB78AC|nr:alpha/beta hydrolase [Xanthovirga aplysinae]MTI30608.1 alpha/beta hydrolase [Xanthovirga aplysinae]